jgi:hypothetical protein
MAAVRVPPTTEDATAQIERANDAAGITTEPASDIPIAEKVT